MSASQRVSRGFHRLGRIVAVPFGAFAFLFVGSAGATEDLPVSDKAKRYCGGVLETDGIEEARTCLALAVVTEEICLRADNFDVCMSEQIKGFKKISAIRLHPEPLSSEFAYAIVDACVKTAKLLTPQGTINFAKAAQCAEKAKADALRSDPAKP